MNGSDKLTKMSLDNNNKQLATLTTWKVITPMELKVFALNDFEANKHENIKEGDLEKYQETLNHCQICQFELFDFNEKPFVEMTIEEVAKR